MRHQSLDMILLIITVLILHSLFVLCLSLQNRFPVLSRKGPSANRHYFERPSKSKVSLAAQPMRQAKDSKENDLCAASVAKSKPFLDFNGIMPIIEADNSEILSEMIKQGRVSDIDMSKDNDSKSTLLTEACNLRSLGCVKVLLNNGAALHTNSMNHDPLTNACKGGDIELINLIFNEWHNINNDSDIIDYFILHCFSLSDVIYNTEVTTVLLDRITDINIFSNSNGYGLLHYAVEYNNIELVKTLLDRGIDREEENDSGYTALTMASARGNIDIVKLLLYYNGINNNNSNNNNNTITIASMNSILNALESLSLCGDIEVVRIMIEAIPNTNNATLTCAFHIAISSHRIEMIKLLLSRGVDVHAMHNGKTALSCSTSKSFWPRSPEGDPAVHPGQYCEYFVYYICVYCICANMYII